MQTFRTSRFWIVCVGLLTVGARVGRTKAADTVDAKGHAARIMPYLDDRAVAMVRVDLMTKDGGGLMEELLQLAGEMGLSEQNSHAAGSLSELRWLRPDWLSAMRQAGARELFVVFGAPDSAHLFRKSNPWVPTVYWIASVSRTANRRAIAGLMFSGQPNGPTSATQLKGASSPSRRRSSTLLVAESFGQVVFMGPSKTLDRLRRIKPQPRPETSEAFTTAVNDPIQFVLVLSRDQRRVIRELGLPGHDSAASMQIGSLVADSLRWISVAPDEKRSKCLHCVIQSEDAGSAGRLRALVTDTWHTLNELDPVRAAVPNADRLGYLLTPQLTGDRLTLTIDLRAQPVRQLAVALGKRATAHLPHRQLQVCIRNLKQLALAMHAYDAAHGHFPTAASYDGHGRPLLSWRVHLLPYLGHADLYKQFHLNESWDSDHNRDLIKRMPQVFACPASTVTSEGMTTYLAPVGKDTVFPQGSTVKLQDITDGTSVTILLVDAARNCAVPWTKPADLSVDLDKPANGLFDQHTVRGETVTPVVAGDGAVHALPKSVTATQLRGLFLRNDGELISF